MQIEISPKKQFLAAEAVAANFRAMAVGPTLPIAISHALAEFSMFHQSSPEQLEGVRKFVAVLLNMGEKDEPTRQHPVKRLDHSIPEKAIRKPKPATKP